MSHEQKATWIWYPGDFEIWLHAQLSLRRTERGTIVPPFWRLDWFCPSVKFMKKFDLQKPEEVELCVQGRYNVELDGKYIYDNTKKLILPEGEHTLVISVVHETLVPAIFMLGETITTNESWEVTNNNHKWLKADHRGFDDPGCPPTEFRFKKTENNPVKADKFLASIFADFGRETFGYPKLNGVSGSGKVIIYYGESEEEALSTGTCELKDEIVIDIKENGTYTFPHSRAFRYLNVKWDRGVEINNISMLYEYLPVEYRGSFHCSNEIINKIWDTAIYTLHLNTREFLLDGIKRDRWVWSGDAYQSFLLNYYSFFDEDVNRRTLVALRGKDPVETHINWIMDYSFYWFMGIYDYYLYTGDIEFVRGLYDKMLSLMDFCLGRRNENGMMEGIGRDWVFIDWAPIDNKGEVSTEQILFCRSLEIMAQFSQLLGDSKKEVQFTSTAQELKDKIMSTFWDDAQGGLVHGRIEGELNRHLTKYPNIFAMLFNYLDEKQSESVKRNVLQNDKVQPITTPYMRFYELASLCEIGEQASVTQEILDYWGGMLELGATTFWEEYNPALFGSKHYEMYDRPFGKSLCHAWGASPIYLLGKYYLGVRPLTAGYETYLVKPNLGGLTWIEGIVPMPVGGVSIYMDDKSIRLKGSGGIGCLQFYSVGQPSVSNGDIRYLGEKLYELRLEPGEEYLVNYTKT